MTKGGKIPNNLDELLWEIGWKSKWVFLGGMLLFIITAASDAPDAIAGMVFLAAFILPIAGIVYVWLNYKQVLQNGEEVCKQTASEIIDLDQDNVEQFQYHHIEDEGWSILPPKTHKYTTVVVDDVLVDLHEDSTVHLPSLMYEVEEKTNEFYYDQITDVSFTPNDQDDKGRVEIRLSHGDSARRFESSREGGEAVNALQDRLRTYKRQSAKQATD